MFEADHAAPRHSERFRWLISTCLAATIGAVALIVVIFGSADTSENANGLIPRLQRLREGDQTVDATPQLRREGGLKWSVPKTDRLQEIGAATSTRFVIHDTLKQRRSGREYVYAKPYVRIVARLAPVPADYMDVIPPFNPYKLYSNSNPISTTDDDGEEAGSERKDVSIKVVELLGNILPGEDGQELDTQEVADIVERANQSETGKALPGSKLEDTSGWAAQKGPAAAATRDESASTTTLAKTVVESDDAPDELEGGQVRVVKVGPGDTLTKILTRNGAEVWQARAMIEAARGIFLEQSLIEGQEVHITLVASLTEQNRFEPARFSIFSDGHDHVVSVTRSSAGEFVASATPFAGSRAARAGKSDDNSQNSSLYAGLYHASLVQQVPSDTIMRILRNHAYEADFRRRVRGGDMVELFFDLKDENGTEGPPGELLYSAITSGGETSRFYRYRTLDDATDYYDAEGSNSRKFLIKKPVQSLDARLTSGYGLRFHPLLNERRMHTGVDWAAAPGTPILAAGKGFIEEAGRKGQYGNYVRIRHGNGYQTAYGHMLRVADGVRPGVKVRQNDIIGYVGSTGLSSGPHVHYEVLVNNQFVNPTNIQVPQERRLEGKELLDFQKERSRVDELIRRVPVQKAIR